MAHQGALFSEQSELPNGLVYRPGFLTREEESRTLEAIAALALEEAVYKSYTARRRIASFGAGYDFDAHRLTPAPEMAPFLLPLRDKVARWAGLPEQAFGEALVSEYRPGTPLGWHRDVPQFEVIAGISLASACRMRFRPYPPKRGDAVLALELEPRSAYLLRGEARWSWQHSIPPTPQLRYSITLRTRRGKARP